MEERRKQPRKDLMSYAQVFNVEGGYLLGYLGDLTELGAMIISEDEANPHTELTIQIQLPELPHFSEETITLPVRVAWCKRDLSPAYFNIGMEFKAVTDRQRDIIRALLENYEFRRQTPNYPPHPNELNISE